MTYSKQDAEDLFQETFLRVLERPQKLAAANDPRSFLFSTALFLWRSWKRKYARRKRIAPAAPLDETVESGMDVEDGYLLREERQAVRELVRSLPEKLQIPTILYYTVELSIPEIAAALRVPEGTVKSRLYKARKLVEKGLVSKQDETG